MANVLNLILFFCLWGQFLAAATVDGRPSLLLALGKNCDTYLESSKVDAQDNSRDSQRNLVLKDPREVVGFGADTLEQYEGCG